MLKDKDLQYVARQSSLSARIVLRLCDAIGVQEAPNEIRYYVGFRLHEVFKGRTIEAEVLDVFVAGIAEVRNACPKVYQWLTHGGFDPSKVPDDLQKVHIQHAVRVFGRVRARIIRTYNASRCGKVVDEHLKDVKKIIS